MEPLRDGDPRQVGAYRLVGRLGAGGMGQVFLGDSPGGRKVAVKILLSQHAADEEFRRRFAREVTAARQVGGFHTAPVVDADPGADPPWMVTAYIPGPSLADAVRDGGPLDPEAVRALGAALAEGLAAIHACGLVHRDLKPGNIILAADGPRIIDFGIARAADATALTSSGMLIGTFSFMSPEQVGGEPADARSDVFSLGSVLAYAATGRGPFDAPSIPAIVHRIASEPADLAGIDSPLAAIIAACLAKDPADRPSVTGLIALLTDSAPMAVPPQPTVPQLPTQPAWPTVTTGGHHRTVSGLLARSRKPRVLLTGAASLIAVAGVAIGFAVSSAGQENQRGTTGVTQGTQSRAPASSAPASSTPAFSAAALPGAYVGHWRGMLQEQLQNRGPQTADLTITGGTAGKSVGTGSYPGDGCTYDIQLVSADASQATLRENVRSGLSCLPDYVVLRSAGQGLKEDVYLTDPSQGSGILAYTGQLSRVS